MADEVKENNKQLVCEIKIDAEMMRKIIDEKMTQIELDIQEIRAKAIDELKNEICTHFADWKYSEDEKCIKDLIELASESVEEIAEQMKAGVDNGNK